DIIDTAYHKARDLQSQNKRSATPLEVIDLRLHRLENTLACLVEDNRPKSTVRGDADIDPDTAITAFMGWLTSRDEVVGPFSSRHDPSVELIKQFCEAQDWHASNERFHQQIKLLKERYP
ncbi:MAG TPA: hypothetical protein VHV10_21235, partial [Ktedonobacteraceae bacterium]|nr:hypothetical protein [Ktedonobacteraceae bacterium]